MICPDIKKFLNSYIYVSGDFLDENSCWQRGKVWGHPDFTVMEFEDEGEKFLYRGKLYSQEEFLKIIRMKVFW
jgi:hypothetical protein